MPWNKREGSPYRARGAISALDKRGITLPSSVTAAVAELDRIENSLPPEPPSQQLHDAIVAGADQAELDAMVLSELGSSRIRAAYAQAKLTAAVRVLAALLEARNDIHPQLAEQAHTAISQLEQLAELDDDRLDTLIRTGRHDDAKLVADRELIGAELTELFKLRDLHLTPGGVDNARPSGVDCTRWHDVRRVANKLHGSQLENFITGIRAGGQLWYPTPEQAAEAAAPIAAQLEQEAEQRRQREFGMGAFAG